MLNLAVDNKKIVEDQDFPGCSEGYRQSIVGRSDEIKAVFRLVEKVADSGSTIMINGETDTGKGLVARAIHGLSRRREKPFVTINCGAIPENLLESELFGHVKGAFTGAATTKTGKFEAAKGGTIFLDEIGDMSPDLQVKLLRVLEEGEFEPVGGCRTLRTDVRILAATHRNLEKAVEEGKFRRDLFFRLYVIPIKLPSLKSRCEDVPLLIHHFIDILCEEKSMDAPQFDDSAMAALVEFAWPGNVRELKNIVERLVVLNGGETVSVKDLPERFHSPVNRFPAPGIKISKEGICLNSAVTEFEKSLILQSLEKTNGIKNRAAKLLHMNRTTLVEKIKRHQL
ncbi:MAG: sigma-54-dependent Fis family transcriptional regulator [Deltaproteobacteria bacterium]|nr:MAG: sigma-54-dependent Fis family transcriptional regulator [Deltaproteobacteria bacterium]